MSLLYDDNDHDDLELPSFGVNKAFAEKYESKKRGEELSKRTSNSSTRPARPTTSQTQPPYSVADHV